MSSRPSTKVIAPAVRDIEPRWVWHKSAERKGGERDKHSVKCRNIHGGKKKKQDYADLV